MTAISAGTGIFPAHALPTAASADDTPKRPSLMRMAGGLAGTLVGGTAGYLAGGRGGGALARAATGAAIGTAVGYNLGNAYSGIGMGTRHLIDSAAFGVASDRWDMRNSYRNDYSNAQQLGAEVFDAGTVLLAGAGGAAFIRKVGGQVLRNPSVRGVVGLAAGAGASVAIGVAGMRKTMHHVEDRGNLRPALGTAGMVIGAGAAALLGRRGGRMAAATVVTGAGAAGLLAGSVVGSKLKTGESKLGVDSPKINIPAESVPGRIGEFGKASLVQFVDSGPPTQGLSFSGWRAEDHFRKNYSKSEQAGGMAGNALAAAVHVGGALATVKALRAAGGGEAALQALGPVSRRIAPKLGQLAAHPGAKGGLVAVGGLIAAHDIARARAAGGTTTDGLANTGVSLAIGGVGALVAKGRGVNPMNSLVTGIALASAVSLARTPVNSFINQSRVVWNQADAGEAKIAAGVGGAVLGAAGIKVGANVGGAMSGGRAIGKVVGGAVGGAVGALAGIGAAPVMPFVGKADEATLPVEPPADSTEPEIGTPVVDEDGDGVPDEMAPIVSTDAAGRRRPR